MNYPEHHQAVRTLTRASCMMMAAELMIWFGTHLAGSTKMWVIWLITVMAIFGAAVDVADVTAVRGFSDMRADLVRDAYSVVVMAGITLKANQIFPRKSDAVSQDHQNLFKKSLMAVSLTRVIYRLYVTGYSPVLDSIFLVCQMVALFFSVKAC
ncbi:uncharacterized protein LALA0_S04e08240g [Lachancea lanzarotensis]|uniref:LALA0S04e08240g1_1 n=1 Tax=Lachancea lanzarotensis TaxID=1245769 RepID=A0A0C7N9K9_9SACH|nr:uncharacterized protein LALA0_S04e08240g [Lachancea lanzarotensis]CEP62118.1 LALA0S04e08240g1_1 [Lachancea lanzarotensis]